MAPDYSFSDKTDEGKDRQRLIFELRKLRVAYTRQAEVIARYERLFEDQKKPTAAVHEELEVQRELVASLNRQLREKSEDFEAQKEEQEAAMEELRISLEDQSKAEEALRESETRFRTAIKHANFVLSQFDRDLKYTWIHNPHPDFDASLMVGKRGEELEDSEGMRRLTALKRLVVESGKDAREEISFSRSDGVHTYDTTVEPLFDYAGAVIGGVVSAFDVTERKGAEEALRESQALLYAVIEGTPDPIFIKDRHSLILMANPATLRLIGKPLEEVIGKDDRSHYADPAIGEAIMANDRRIMESGKTEAVEEVVQTPDGYRTFISTKTPYRNSNGEIIGILGVARDITERKQAQTLSDALNSINMAINVSLDFNRTVETVAIEATKAIGFSRATIALREGGDWVIKYTLGDLQRPIGFKYNSSEIRTIKELLSRKKPILLTNAQNNSLANHEEAKKYNVASSVLIPLIVNDDIVGIFSFSDSKNIILSDAQVDFVNKLSTSLALAISNAHLYEEARHELQERKRTEEELRAAKAQAELYVDLMGHDINNLHQIALGYLELARDMPPGENKDEFLDKPVEVLQRSAMLIKNVRKLQKLHDGVFRTEDVDVCQVLSHVQREFGANPHKTVKLNLNGLGSCHVRANELLHDVYANLVSNAIKHTGDKADIILDLDVVKDNGNRYCRVMVEDNGPGIPDDFKAIIFNRMLKGNNGAKGMGLGLYLVKSLVDSYGGRVWVDDRIMGNHMKGAKFVVMLPAVET